MRGSTVFGVVLVLLVIVSGFGIHLGRRIEAAIIRPELEKLEGRLQVLEEAFIGCEPVTVHQTLDEGMEMVQLLCPEGIGPRPEAER